MQLEGLQHSKSHTSHKREAHAMETLSGSVDWSGSSNLPGSIEHDRPSATPQDNIPRQRKGLVWIILLVPLFVILLITLATFLHLFDRAYDGQIYPNVSIRGVNVGKMTREQAVEALQNQYTPFLEQPLTVTYGEQTWNPGLKELGVQLNFDTAVQEAMDAGRHHGLITNLREVAAVWQRGLEIPLRLTIDQQAIQTYLLTIAPEIDQPAIDAQVILDATTAETVSSMPGQQVLVDETVYEIMAALQALEPQTVALRTRQLLPLLSDTDAAAAQRAIEKLLQGPIILQTRDQTWEWSVEDLSQMVLVQRAAKTGSGSEHLTASFDNIELQQRLRKISKTVSKEYINPLVDWNGGDLTIFREGKAGYILDIEEASNRILAAAPTSDRVIELPFKEQQPPVTEENLQQLGIQELVAVGRSDFSGSAGYRITNIKAGMRLLHGILLGPDEEFSFNKNIGSISAENGFVEGYAIVKNRTQLEWGGGICQDSTTVFRAAFWAGLPITERWGHSFYISWYDKYGYGDYGDGPGMDATIFTGGPDLKFLNDTGHWLLIQAYADPSRALAEVRIYGTKPDRTVTLEGPDILSRIPPPSQPVYVPEPSRPRGAPRRTDTARGGMSIAFTRIISDGAETKRERFTTYFKPWPNIYEINPADLGSDGQPLPPQTPTPTPQTAYPAPAPEPGQPAPAPEPGQPAPAPPAEATPVPVIPTEEAPPQPLNN